ncbi:recombinase family protein [Microbacterium sp. B24]|uniref:recombinase family protein n=1 Tax=Microbacterium sp. B24 TaxID=95616 RepID=UPI000426D4D0|nr:recombinase family protein [Microbacterium sp. B24]
MGKTAGIYARISNADKKAPKVDQQIDTCRMLAEEHGLEVLEDMIFFDDGIAASGKNIDDTTLQNRPGAQALLKAMKDGQFDVLLATEGERISRTYLDGLQFIQASSEGKVTWLLDVEGAIDPSTPAGEEVAVSIFASGRREGRIRDARQTRRYNQERKAGMPLWGTRPFGYEPDRITIREAEASLIRQAVTDYLAGTRSFVRITHDWNDAGIQTDGMQRERKGRDGTVKPAVPYWKPSQVRNVLLRPRNAGILVHRGEELPNSQIQPIITREQYEELKFRDIVPTGKRGAPATSLLGGIIRCECGAPMHNTMAYSQRKGGPRNVYTVYKCSQTVWDKTRKHATIQTHIPDNLVTARLTLALFKDEVHSETPHLAERLNEIRAERAAYAEERVYNEGLVLEFKLKSLHGRARLRLSELEELDQALADEADLIMAQMASDGALDAFYREWREGPDGFATKEEADAFTARFWQAWEAEPLESKRAMIKRLFKPVVRVGGRGLSRIRFEGEQPPQPIELDEE